MRQTIDYGIDLGTTNSAIALFREDEVHVFNDGPMETVPSVVRIDRRGNVYVGATAYDKLFHDSPNTHSEFKRLMGTDKKLRFEATGREMLPEELSAEVLKTLCALPTERGEAVDAAVITVPAMFEVPACAATKRAAEIAGLQFITLLPEPIAAAYAYGFREEFEGFLFIYDLGGGTFDASILRAEDGRLSVIDHAGDNHLGGKNFDWLIVEEIFLPQLAEQYDLPGIGRGEPRYARLMGRLKSIAENCKIDLSRMEAVSIFEEDLAQDDAGKTVDLDVEVTRGRYVELVAPMIDRTLETCRTLLEANNLAPADVRKLLLVGGPTRTPYVRDRIESLGVSIDLNVNPMTVVARGAAIYARSQRLPRILAEQEREAGRVYATLEYLPMSDIEDPLLGGRLEGDVEIPAGCTIEIAHVDGHWESGRISISESRTFICTLHLNRNQSNEFRLRLRGPDEQHIELEPGSVNITHGLRTDEAPMRSSIRIGLADGTTQVVLPKGTALPATSAEIRLRTVRAIRPGTGDAIEVPILEGEEARADRNRGGGKLLVSAKHLRRELPAGSTLDFTMTVDSAGVPEKVSVYAEYLDEWFDNFERATTEFASLEDLEAQRNYEVERLERLCEQARTAGEQELEERAEALRRGAELRNIAQQLNAVAGGDNDAAGVARNALIEIGKRIDALESEVEWPHALRAYEAERTDCRRVVHEYGKRGHEDQLATLENEAEECVRRRDHAGLEQRRLSMLGLEIGLLREQPQYWHARYQWLAEQNGSFTDNQRADALIREGNQAIGRDDVYSLQSICDDLTRLLPRGVLDGAPSGMFRSDVEL